MLLIDAKDDEARRFYLHQAEFHASPTDPLHLFLPIKHARALIADALTRSRRVDGNSEVRPENGAACPSRGSVRNVVQQA